MDRLSTRQHVVEVDVRGSRACGKSQKMYYHRARARDAIRQSTTETIKRKR